ncbi:MAG: FHA domain-containing protein, partial [Nitrospiraceae bacterium]
MKFALVHLSGQNRGQTQYFDCSRLSLGSDHHNDLTFPADGPSSGVPSHVDLYEENCEIHLRNHDPNVTIMVSDNPLDRAVLHDKDVIQLGPQGPKFRFRIRAEEYAACKRSREILRDALDVASEARKDGLGPLGSFLG